MEGKIIHSLKVEVLSSSLLGCLYSLQHEGTDQFNIYTDCFVKSWLENNEREQLYELLRFLFGISETYKCFNFTSFKFDLK